MAAAQLRGMNVGSAEVIASSKINAALLGDFQAALHAGNFEYSLRSHIGAEEEFKGEDDDERKHRHSTVLTDVTVSHEDSGFSGSDDFVEKMARARATEYARGVANIRGSEADPEYMEQAIRALAEGKDHVKEIRVLKGQELKELGMNLFYEVGKGAESPPRYVMVHYQGNQDSDEVDLALVGKGLTFDTGGLNLKPTRYIEEMHLDKGGACAVMGALHGTLELKPKKNVVFVMALAENAIGQSVYKPGDIIKSLNSARWY